MNSLLRSLKEVCESHVLQEKILIVPSYGAGHMICEALARAGGGWVNLHSETVNGLAQQVAGEYLAEKNITFLTDNLASTVIEEVFRELDGRGALKYFTRQGSSSGLVRSIASSISELRSCGIKADSMTVESYVSTDKGCDMIALVKAYERYLDEHQYIDSSGLLALALNKLPFMELALRSEVIYLLPSFIQLYSLEEQVVKAIAGENLFVLQADRLYGLHGLGAELPDYVDGSQLKPASETGRLPWLYSVEYSPQPVGDGSISYFHAYGITNEAREILRLVNSEKLPLDAVTVAVASDDYIQVFYSLSKLMGFNITVAGGIPAFLSGPGKALKGIIEWIRNDFAESSLRKMLTGGYVRLYDEESGEYIPPASAARMLRGSGIGWGRQRYRLLLDIQKSCQEQAVEAGDDGEGHDMLASRGELAGKLHRVLQKILGLVPQPDASGMVDYRAITEGLAEIVSTLARVRNESDAAGLSVIVANLKNAGLLASFGVEPGEALERVEDLLDGCRFGAAGPKPGHLHITGVADLIWSFRPHTFAAGLDANAFPGGVRQDPVLLDMERAKISNDLPLGSERPLKRHQDLAIALASRRGRVVMSFSSFDVIENKSVFPSSVLLQVYRLLKGDPSLDYSDLLSSLSEPAGFCPISGATLDETEWWVARVLREKTPNGESVVKECYRGIDQGQLAAEARSENAPTEYDGLIAVEPSELDPRENPGVVLSCSRIEFLAGCPFAYFLKHVLKIYPPEEIVYDPARWLDPMERGSLLHQVFCDFMRKVAEKGEKAGAAAHRPMMLAIADEVIAGYREMIPPPSKVVFNREVRDIHICCEVFLSAEEQHSSRPVYFEVPFGLGADEVKDSGYGLPDPLEIAVGRRSFKLAGKIDRIDRVKDEIYSVWDYKTGSTYGYEEHRFLYGGDRSSMPFTPLRLRRY